jgi:NADH-quinone oxidoreductase subunit N
MTSISVALHHSLPELILAIGALAITLYGALRWTPERRAGDRAGDRLSRPRRRHHPHRLEYRRRGVRGAFVNDAFARFMKLLALIGSLATLTMSQNYLRRENMDRFEFPVLVLLVDARHDDDDLGERSDRALCRPRAA